MAFANIYAITPTKKTQRILLTHSAHNDYHFKNTILDFNFIIVSV
jgi:hypothetical protein